MRLRAPDGKPDRNRLAFELTGLDVDESYLGDPTADSDVSLCIYDDGQLVAPVEIPASQSLGSQEPWKTIGGRSLRGFRYKDRDLRFQGKKRAVFRASSRSSSRPNGRLVFATKGATYDPPEPVAPGAGTKSDPGQQFSGPLVAQVHNSAHDNCLSIVLDETGHAGELNRSGNYRDRCDSVESRGLIPDCDAMP